MNTLDNLTLTGKATAGVAASAANDLVRLVEAQALVTSLFQGAYQAGTAYTAGQMATSNGGLYVARVGSTGYEPSANPTQWAVLVESLASAYVYVAYASDASGTGFTTTFNSALDYIAIKATSTAIASPAVGDFTGLWKNYKGATGAAGEDGEDGTVGTDGVSAYLYVRYASDSSGTGFSATPTSPLTYRAEIQSATVITTPVAGDFIGKWVKYLGSDGAAGEDGEDGAAGTNGADGVNAYLYVRYASDASGTGFSATPTSSLTYRAEIQSSTVLTPTAGDFSGKWVKYLGTDGTNGTNGTNGTAGAAGAAGANAYLYQAWASDASGTGFTTTFNAALDYTALKLTTTAIGSPGVGDFAGLWTKYRGAAGPASGSVMAVTPTAISYAALSTDEVILVTADGKTVTLPSAVGIAAKSYIIKQTAAYSSGTTVATTSSQTIDGAGSYTIAAQWGHVRVVSDGSNWVIV